MEALGRRRARRARLAPAAAIAVLAAALGTDTPQVSGAAAAATNRPAVERMIDCRAALSLPAEGAALPLRVVDASSAAHEPATLDALGWVGCLALRAGIAEAHARGLDATPLARPTLRLQDKILGGADQARGQRVDRETGGALLELGVGKWEIDPAWGLVGVLGHEIGHVLMSHEDWRAWWILAVAMVFVAGAVLGLGTKGSRRVACGWVLAGVSALGMAAGIPWGMRLQEFDADAFGVAVLARETGSSALARGHFGQMLEGDRSETQWLVSYTRWRDGGDLLVWLRHPSNAQRLAAIRAWP